MARNAVVFRGSVRGARRAGHGLRSGAREIQRYLLDEFAYRIAPTATRIFRNFAPHDSGRLERGLQARVRSYGGRIVIEVVSTARSDRGYDYLPVTRHGHRVAIIRPVHAKALRIPLAGGVIYRKFVRGYHPTHDWAQSAFDAMDRELEAAQARIGRVIDRALR